MTSATINLRKQIIDKKRTYTENQLHTLAIEAAIDKAEYIINGGTKLIILPQYCDIITIIAMDIIKVTQKGLLCTRDMYELTDYINKNFVSIYSINLTDQFNLEININNVNKVNTRLPDEIDEFFIIELATLILNNSSDVQFSNEELGQFKKYLLRLVKINLLRGCTVCQNQLLK